MIDYTHCAVLRRVFLLLYISGESSDPWWTRISLSYRHIATLISFFDDNVFDWKYLNRVDIRTGYRPLSCHFLFLGFLDELKRSKFSIGFKVAGLLFVYSLSHVNFIATFHISPPNSLDSVGTSVSLSVGRNVTARKNKGEADSLRVQNPNLNIPCVWRTLLPSFLLRYWAMCRNFIIQCAWVGTE